MQLNFIEYPTIQTRVCMHLRESVGWRGLRGSDEIFLIAFKPSTVAKVLNLDRP